MFTITITTDELSKMLDAALAARVAVRNEGAEGGYEASAAAWEAYVALLNNLTDRIEYHPES